MVKEPLKYEKLKCMIAIVDRGRGEKIVKLMMRNLQDPYHFMCLGRGTASSEVLDYFGIGETEKDIIFSFLPENIADYVMHEQVGKDFNFHKAGHGVACTISITSVNRIIAKKITDIAELNKDLVTEGGYMENSDQFELIITILAQGYSDEAMDAAREAGARGGTVIHARGLGGEEAAKFLGIMIQPEKEILLVITKKHKKAAVMESISKRVGLCTKGRGICFALPVDDVVGLPQLNLVLEQENS